jgi:hypothetical protein
MPKKKNLSKTYYLVALGHEDGRSTYVGVFTYNLPTASAVACTMLQLGDGLAAEAGPGWKMTGVLSHANG